MNDILPSPQRIKEGLPDPMGQIVIEMLVPYRPMVIEPHLLHHDGASHCLFLLF